LITHHSPYLLRLPAEAVDPHTERNGEIFFSGEVFFFPLLYSRTGNIATLSSNIGTINSISGNDLIYTAGNIETFTSLGSTIQTLSGTTLTYATANLTRIQNNTSLSSSSGRIDALTGDMITYPTSNLDTINTTIVNAQNNSLVIRNNTGNVSIEAQNGSITITGHDVHIGTLSDLLVENLSCNHLQCGDATFTRDINAHNITCQNIDASGSITSLLIYLVSKRQSKR